MEDERKWQFTLSPSDNRQFKSPINRRDFSEKSAGLKFIQSSPQIRS